MGVPLTLPNSNMISSEKNISKRVQPGVAESKFASLIISIFLTSVFLINGCATAPPLSPLESSLITNDTQKASIVIYRSNEESWMHRVFIDVHIDGQPFMQLMRGEYIQTYLPAASHMIKAVYDRFPGVDHAEDQKMVDLKSEHVLYMEIVPSFEGWAWACGVACFPICAPMPGPKVDLLLKTEEDARKVMGRAVDRELLRERIIMQH